MESGFFAPEMMIIYLPAIMIAVAIIPFIFFIITLSNTMKRISIENQKMPPGNMWLLLIPFFSLIWNFIVVNKMADSLQAEFAKRNITVSEERPGYNIGLTMAICFCASIIPAVGILARLEGLITWIMYWVKIAQYKSMLANEYMPDILDQP